MAVTKSLMAVLAVLLVAGSGAAVTGLAQTDAGASSASVSHLSMDATMDNETVTVTVTDDGTPVENATLSVEGDEEVIVTTDANGTATINRSALTESDESLVELEIEYETDHAEGTLEYVVTDGSLTLVEEKYEYDIGDEADDAEPDDDESEENESEENENEEKDDNDEDDEADADEESDDDEDDDNEDDEDDDNEDDEDDS